MTSLSGRAFVTAATASLLVACGGNGHPAARSTSTPPPPPASSSPAAQSTGPVKDAVHALGRSVPVRIQIPAIGVDTPVMRLGLAPDGTAQVPPVTAHDRAGWYGHSPTPGQVGPSVILGHVTVGKYGDGVFRHLARLHRGDRIVARLGNGTSAVFTVRSLRTVAKSHFPTEQVYGDVDHPELRLITCGGPRTGDGYADNVIVFAGLSGTTP
ncbi:class F sortase [Streptomyces sp. NPDC020801]|uniref:class F sortase n=1 Tax=unclassified Streptomyces TaxID=2593676 RepID=UPI0037AA0E4E